MTGEQQSNLVTDASQHDDSALSAVGSRYQEARKQLLCAYRQSRPFTILTGTAPAEVRRVVDDFAADLGDNATFIRISASEADADASMRQIIREIGFEPNGMSPADLEKVLMMFLEFQRKHHRRTVIDVGDGQDQSPWMLDNMRRLIELECEGRYGAMVLLSGRPALTKVIEQPPLDSVRDKAGRRIELPPMSLDETNEMLRIKVEETSDSDICQLFEFPAVSLIHELSEGEPDAVDTLYVECLNLAEETNTMPVTCELVQKAHDSLGKESALAALNDDAVSEVAVDMPYSGEMLVISQNGTVICEQPLDKDRLLIGRGKLCDVQLRSRLVSRHHALFIRVPAGVKILDIGSTNGTYLGEHRVRDRLLEDGNTLRIGDCRVKYVSGER